MIRKLSAPSALGAALAVGFTVARAPLAQAHGGITGTTSMIRDCPMTNDGRAGNHHDMRREG